MLKIVPVFRSDVLGDIQSREERVYYVYGVVDPVAFFTLPLKEGNYIFVEVE